MSWITITTDDLKDAKAATIVTALQTSALEAGQTDPTPHIIASVITHIRAEIKGCASNLLDADLLKIPSSLKGVAARMILREMASRLQMPLTPDEQREHDADERLLLRVSQGQMPVELTENPDAGLYQTTTGHPAITARTPIYRRSQQDGI